MKCMKNKNGNSLKDFKRCLLEFNNIMKFRGILMLLVYIFEDVFIFFNIYIFSEISKSIDNLNLTIFYLALFLGLFFLRKVYDIFIINYYVEFKLLNYFEKAMRNKLHEMAKHIDIEFHYADNDSLILKTNNSSINIFRFVQSFFVILNSMILLVVLTVLPIILNYSISLVYYVIILVIVIYMIVYNTYNVKAVDKINSLNNETNLLFNNAIKVDDFEENSINGGFIYYKNKLKVLKGQYRNNILHNKKVVIFTIFLLLIFVIIGFKYIFSRNLVIDYNSFMYIYMIYVIVTNILSIIDTSKYLYFFKDLSLAYFDYQNHVLRAKPKKTSKNSLEINNLFYNYPASKKQVLNNINLTIKKGEKIALVGDNGSGKTTLARYICGIQKNTKVITFKSSSAVFQSFSTYPISVKDNILINGQNISEKEIKKFIEDFEQDFSLEVTGINLSSGQKQVLAIIRGISKSCDLVILDEITAYIDPFKENNIYKQIFKYCDDLAVIIISHKLACIKYVNRIIVMENGSITCDGKKDYVANHSKKYKEMLETKNRLYN